MGPLALPLMARRARNFLTYTEDFSNAAWQQVLSATITGGTVGPTGIASAGTIAFNASNGNRIEQDADLAAVNGHTYTAGVWLKGSGTMHINTGTTTGVGGQGENQITLSGTWTFSTATFTAASPTGFLRLMLIWRTGDTATGCDLAFPQLGLGSTAVPYERIGSGTGLLRAA